MIHLDRRSLLRAFIGGLVAMRVVDGIGSALAADDDLLLVNGWIVRRSQLPKDKKSRKAQ